MVPFHILPHNIMCNTIVSRASTHYQVSVHVLNLKGSMLLLPYKCMQFLPQVSTHVSQNCELCLSDHGRLLRTLQY